MYLFLYTYILFCVQAEILIEKLRKAVNIGKVIDAYTPAGKYKDFFFLHINEEVKISISENKYFEDDDP